MRGTVVRPQSRIARPAGCSLLLVLSAVLLWATPATHTPHARAAGQPVHYAAGWHLVAAPSGSDLGAQPGSLYAYGPASAGYQPVAPADTIGGRGYWAYFGKDTDVTLDATPATYTRMILPGDHFAIIGNPSTTQTLPISGAAVAYTYDSTRGYTPVRELAPGQAAFVLPAAGADVTVGKPTSQAGAAAIRALQAGLTQDAADVSSFGKLPGVAEALLNTRDYALVQTAQDDTRAAFADGLLLEHAAAPPTLTAVQRDAGRRVRQALAQAQTDTAAGNSTAADQQVRAARSAAQTAEDDAAAVARVADATDQIVPAPRADTPSYTPRSLARYGNLCNATVFALALNLPPSDAFVALVVATLTNQPPPPADGTATPPPAAGA
jgi:hypothetical protein